MTRRNYFIVGIKLIGVYCLLWGVEGIFRVFPEQKKVLEGWGDIHGIFVLSALMSMAIPLIMGGLGLYLIRDGRRLHSIPKLDEGRNESQRWITLGMVLFGFYLLASSVPDVLGIIPEITIALQPPAYVSGDGLIHWLKSNFFPTAVTVLLGMLCVFRGQAIAAFGTKCA